MALIDYTKRQQSVLSAHMQERERLYTDLAAQHQRDAAALQELISTKDQECRQLRSDVVKLSNELGESSRRATQSVQHVRDELTAAMAMHQGAMRALQAEHRSDVDDLRKQYEQQLRIAQDELQAVKALLDGAQRTAEEQRTLLAANSTRVVQDLREELSISKKQVEACIEEAGKHELALELEIHRLSSLLKASEERSASLQQAIDQSTLERKALDGLHEQETIKLRQELSAAHESIVRLAEEYEIQLVDAKAHASHAIQQQESNSDELLALQAMGDTFEGTVQQLNRELAAAKALAAHGANEHRKPDERSSVAARAAKIHTHNDERLKWEHETRQMLADATRVLTERHSSEMENLRQAHVVKIADLSQQLMNLKTALATGGATGTRSETKPRFDVLVKVLQKPLLSSWYHRWRREVTNKQFRSDYQELLQKEERSRSQLMLLVAKFTERQQSTSSGGGYVFGHGSSATSSTAALMLAGRMDGVTTPASIVRSVHNSPSDDSLATTPVSHRQLQAQPEARGGGGGTGSLATPQHEQHRDFAISSGGRSNSALRPIPGNDSPNSSSNGGKSLTHNHQQHHSNANLHVDVASYSSERSASREVAHITAPSGGSTIDDVDALVLRGQQLLGRMTTSLATAGTNPRARPSGPIQAVLRSTTTSSSITSTTATSDMRREKGKMSRREF